MLLFTSLSYFAASVVTLTAADPAEADLVKVVVKPINVIVGEVRKAEALSITVFDLRNQREEQIDRVDLKQVVVNPGQSHLRARVKTT
ncbi:MAG: hypothetical protein SFV23_04515 [Planctomycetaceae bacterium]|nr:hypothetical protein [Planctomycetaceae bacterium]